MDFILHIMISCATKIVTLLLAYHFGLIGWVPTSWFDPIYGITGTVIEEGAGGAASLGFLHRIPVVRSLPLSVQWCAVSHQTAALIPHSSFLIPHSSFSILHSLCSISSFFSFFIPHSSFPMSHSSLLIDHSCSVFFPRAIARRVKDITNVPIKDRTHRTRILIPDSGPQAVHHFVDLEQVPKFFAHLEERNVISWCLGVNTEAKLTVRISTASFDWNARSFSRKQH